MSILVIPGTVTCRIGRWIPVVHRERLIAITRFDLLPFGGRCLTFIGADSRVVYVNNLLGQHGTLIPVLEQAGFEISPGEESRWYPAVWRQRR